MKVTAKKTELGAGTQDRRMLAVKDVMMLTGVSRQEIYRRRIEGRMPPAWPLGKRKIGWPAYIIYQYLATLDPQNRPALTATQTRSELRHVRS